MKKADFKRMPSAKDSWIQWRLADKNFLCTSLKHIRWMKRYLNRAPRRRNKQEVNRLDPDE